MERVRWNAGFMDCCECDARQHWWTFVVCSKHEKDVKFSCVDPGIFERGSGKWKLPIGPTGKVPVKILGDKVPWKLNQNLWLMYKLWLSSAENLGFNGGGSRSDVLAVRLLCYLQGGGQLVCLPWNRFWFAKPLLADRPSHSHFCIALLVTCRMGVLTLWRHMTGFMATLRKKRQLANLQKVKDLFRSIKV